MRSHRAFAELQHWKSSAPFRTWTEILIAGRG